MSQETASVLGNSRERQASIHPTEAHSFVASKYCKWRKGSRPRKGSRSVAWLDGLVEILVSVEFTGSPQSFGAYIISQATGFRKALKPASLDYSPQHWQASSSRLPSSRVMLPAYAGPCLGSRPVAWLDGMVEILVLVEFPTGKGRERVRV